MPFVKGQSGNLQGRKPGTKNKDKELKATIEQVLNTELAAEKLIADLATLKPEKRLEILIKLLPYCLATFKEVNSTVVTEMSLADLLR